MRNINIIILNGRKLNALWKKRSGSLEQRPRGGKCMPCAPEVMGGLPAWNVWFTVRRETRGIRPRGLWLPPQELAGTREPRQHLKADTPCSKGVSEEEIAAPSAWSRITDRLEGAGHGGGQGGSRNGRERCCSDGRGERDCGGGPGSLELLGRAPGMVHTEEASRPPLGAVCAGYTSPVFRVRAGHFPREPRGAGKR